MKKQVLVLAACIVMAAALGGALWFLLSQPPAEDESSSAPDTMSTIADKTVYDLDTLLIKNEQDSFTIKNLGQDSYTIEGVSDVSLQSSRLAGAMNAMSRVVGSVVAEAPAALSAYGLSVPRATATATYTDGGSLAVLFGNEAPGGRGTYAKTADSDTVYLITDPSADNLFMSRLEYIDTVVMAPPEAPEPKEGETEAPPAIYPEDITLGGSFRETPIVIQHDTESITAKQAASYGMVMYKILSPKEREVDMSAGSQPLTELMNVSAQGVAAYQPTDSQIAEFGLDEPYSIASFTYENYEGTAESCVLTVSAPGADGSAYLIRDGVPLVYSVNTAELAWYELRYEDLLSKMFLTPFIDDVASVSVVSPGLAATFNLSGTGDEMKVESAGQEVPIDRFRKYYQTLIGVSGEQYAEGAAPAGETPLLSVTFNYRDTAKAADNITFLPGTARRALVSVNGESEFYARESYVNIIIENTKAITGDGEIKPLY